MNRDRRVRIYDLHSWTGIALGLFVFVVAFTGCFALFEHELRSWEDPALRIALAGEPASMNERFAAWADDKSAQGRLTTLSLQPPTTYEPVFHGVAIVRQPNGESVRFEQRWHGRTGDALPERGPGLVTWLLDFHRDLMWPEVLGGRTIGRSIVGVAGVILMLSILTGVLTHRKILREMFTLRYLRSVRVKWKDTHNLLGVWGLPFHMTIAFTGAFIGIVALLLPILAALTLRGDTDALVEELGLAGVPAAGIAAESVYSLDKAIAHRHPESGKTTEFILIRNWRDQQMQYELFYPADTELLLAESIVLSGTDGTIDKPEVVVDTYSVTGRTIGALTPLHYGTYGGVALKFLYFVLGLSLVATTAFGIMTWIERRWHSSEGKKSARFYCRLSRFSTGVMLGVIVATIAIFYADRLYTGAEEDRMLWIAAIYFGVWLGVVFGAMAQINTYATTRYLLLSVGSALACLPIFNGLTTEFVWQTLGTGHVVAPIADAVFALLGVGLLLVCRGLPSERVERLPTATGETASGSGRRPEPVSPSLQS